MAEKHMFFTSESVTEGHPDKIADQISDAVLDAIIEKDPTARVACETLVTTGLVHVVGEISTHTYVDIPRIVRDTVREIGYTRAKFGFDCDTCGVLVSIDEQSADIAMGVDEALESKEGNGEALDKIGAGDQGMMFGYASNETPELMPLPISLAHRLSRRLAEVRKDGTLTYLRPDGKTQVTVEYVDGKPKRIDTIVISTQHSPEVTQEQIKTDLKRYVIDAALPAEFVDENTKYFINPTGRFVIGGPHGDAGLTGRKIIVDTYGGMARHGGGAFSGKDPSKVDRSAAYAARYVAKNIHYVDSTLVYDVYHKGVNIDRVRLRVPGDHNVLNSLAAFIVAHDCCGVEARVITKGLGKFIGAKRRFETKGHVAGVWVVDDYAHHPTEIKATLKAAKELEKHRVICVFQPHRFSRPSLLKDEFATAFTSADEVYMTDIYSSGEDPIPGIDGTTIPNAIKEATGQDVNYVPSVDDLPEVLAKVVRPNDLVITMGAGSINQYGPKLLAILEEGLQ